MKLILQNPSLTVSQQYEVTAYSPGYVTTYGPMYVTLPAGETWEIELPLITAMDVLLVGVTNVNMNTLDQVGTVYIRDWWQSVRLPAVADSGGWPQIDVETVESGFWWIVVPGAFVLLLWLIRQMKSINFNQP